MSVLVTGGSGFLGGHLVQELERRGESVTIADRKEPVFATSARLVLGDITSEEWLSNMDLSFDKIFHAAGILGTDSTFDHVSETFAVNVMGMVNLLEAVTRSESDPRVINCGLIREWQNPYMISKHTAAKIGAMYSASFGLKFLDARMTVVYGPRQPRAQRKVVPTFIMQALQEQPFSIYGDGQSFMNMMYVKDVAKLLVDLSDMEVFGLSSPVHLDIANPSGDISVLDFAGRVLQEVSPGTTLSSRLDFKDMRPGQPGRVGMDYDLARLAQYMPELKHRFRPLPEGLRDTVAWYRSLL